MEMIKELGEMCEKSVKYMDRLLESGFERVDRREAMDTADIVKDLCMAKMYCKQSEYYEQIVEAMDKSEYGKDYDYMGELRDMDKTKGRMYYTEPMVRNTDNANPMSNPRDSREGMNGQYRKTYLETKQMHPTTSAEDNTMNTKAVEDWLKSFDKDITPLIPDMSAATRQVAKQIILNTANKF